MLLAGSEAVEGAMKLARQYFLEKDSKAPRTKFIARESSWHGCTLGTLAVGDLKARKEPFMDVLADNVSHVSPCHPYRELESGESVEEYVERLALELEAEFQRLGPDNVCAFIIEPMVGTVSYTQPCRLLSSSLADYPRLLAVLQLCPDICKP